MSYIVVLRVGVRAALQRVMPIVRRRIIRELYKRGLTKADLRFGHEASRWTSNTGFFSSARWSSAEQRYHVGASGVQQFRGPKFPGFETMAMMQPHEWLVVLTISALYLAYYYASDLFKRDELIVFSGASASGAFTLPRGVSWATGPCQTYDQVTYGSPVPETVYTGVCNRFIGQYAPMTDDAVNARLASGQTVHFSGVGRLTDFGYQMMGYGSIRADNPSDFEPWNSAIHGFAGRLPFGSLADVMQQRYEDFMASVGLPPLMLPWADLAQYEAVPTVAQEEDYRWWDRTYPFRVPVTLHSTATVVHFPARGNGKAVDVSFPPFVGFRPGVRPIVKPIVRPIVKPGTKPDNPGVPDTGIRNPPVVVHPPVVTPQPRGTVLSKGGAGVRVVAGPVVAARVGTHEPGKGAMGRAMYAAMQVRGQISEVEDGVKAIYKALPASLRKKLRAMNGGRSLNTLDMMRAIYRYWKLIDLEKGVLNVMISQLDDLFVGKSEEAVDQIIRDMVPDFEARMIVRAVMRAGRHGQGFGEGQPTVSALDEAIREYGEADSVDIYPDDMFRFVRGLTGY